MNKSRKMMRAICFATATATTVTTPYITRPYYAMAQVEENQFNFANTICVDISQLEPEDEKIEYHIRENGNYTLTGSNYINEGYVNTTIIVDEGVTANIILDNLHIKINHIPPEVPIGSGNYAPDAGQAIPAFKILGEANFYIQSDSDISAEMNVLRIKGRLNICESIGDAKLTFKTGDYDEYFGDVDSESGEVYIKGGNVEFSNDSNEWFIYMHPNFYIQGGNVLFSSNLKGTYDVTAYCFMNNIIIDGGIICGKNLANGEPIDHVIENGFDRLYEYGYYDKRNSQGAKMYNLTISGLPENEEIVQINHQSVGNNSLSTDADGKLVGVCTKEGEDLVIYTSDQAYIYRYESDTFNTSEPVEVASHKLDFKLNGETIYSQWIGEGLAPEAPSSIAYDYTFTDEAGNPYTEGTPITQDMEITVNATIKTYNVTVDGNPTIAEHGQTLGDVLGKDDVLYKAADGSGKVYDCDFVIKEALALEPVDIGSMTISKSNDGKYYLNIADADDLYNFASLVNNEKLTSINGILTSDIDTTVSSFQTIGCQDYLTADKTQGVNYTGTFDGGYHTINLNIDSPNMAQGVFGAVADGAVIQNLVVDGSVTGGYASAGIVGMVRGGKVTIENCINKADVTVASGSDAAGILGTNLNSSTEVIIRNCGNIGNIEDTDTDGAYAAAISAWLGDNTRVENCFNTGSVTGVDTGDYTDGFARGNYGSDGVKLTNNYTNNEDAWIDGLNKASNDAFKSGEVCYKLNQGQETTVWFQTCGEGYPILNGDVSTQTVYYGYGACTSEEKEYSNSALLREINGHDIHYNYNEATKQITASCSYCDELNNVRAEVEVSDAIVDSSEHGVTVTCNDEWNNHAVSHIIVKYAETEYGVYTEQAPSTAGTWFARLYRADTEEPIATISYRIKAVSNVAIYAQIEGNAAFFNVSQGNIVEGKTVILDLTGEAVAEENEDTVIIPVSWEEPDAETYSKVWVAIPMDVPLTVIDTKIQFTMPTGDVAITAIYKEKATPDPTTPDPTTPVDWIDNTIGFETDENGNQIKKVIETTKDGDKFEVTTTTQVNGNITEQKTLHYKNGKTSLVTETQKNKDNEVTKATAEIRINASKSKNKAYLSLSMKLIDQILEYTDNNDASVTVNVASGTGIECYKVTFDTKDIREKNTLKVYQYDTKTEKYIPVATSDIKISSNNTINKNLPLLEGNLIYQFVNEETAKEIDEKIFDDIRLDTTDLKLSLNDSKKETLQLTGITDGVSKVTYTSSNKKVVTVNKNGVITTKKSGKVTITVKVKLSNRTTKEYKVNVTVK